MVEEGIELENEEREGEEENGSLEFNTIEPTAVACPPATVCASFIRGRSATPCRGHSPIDVSRDGAQYQGRKSYVLCLQGGGQLVPTHLVREQGAEPAMTRPPC